MNRIVALTTAFACLITSGCSIAKFNPDKPIQIESTLLGSSYRQDGKTININEMADELSTRDASKQAMSNYKAVYYPAMGLAGVGGFLIGWNLGDSSSNKSSTPLYIGAGLVAAGIGLGIVADNILKSGVESHNRSKGGKSSLREIDWIPVASVVPERTGGFAGAAGVQIRY